MKLETGTVGTVFRNRNQNRAFPSKLHRSIERGTLSSRGTFGTEKRNCSNRSAPGANRSQTEPNRGHSAISCFFTLKFRALWLDLNYTTLDTTFCGTLSREKESVFQYQSPPPPLFLEGHVMGKEKAGTKEFAFFSL